MFGFVITLLMMASALAAGYLIRILIDRRILKVSIELSRIRRILQSAALLFFIPLTFLGAVWIVDLDNLKILALPFIEVFVIMLGGTLAYAMARAQRMTRRQTGSYIVTGAFGNVGSMGGLICPFSVLRWINESSPDVDRLGVATAHRPGRFSAGGAGSCEPPLDQ